MNTEKLLLRKVLEVCRCKSNHDIETWKTLKKEIESVLAGEKIDIDKIYKRVKVVETKKVVVHHNVFDVAKVTLLERDLALSQKRLKKEQDYTKLLKEKMAKAQRVLRPSKV